MRSRKFWRGLILLGVAILTYTARPVSAQTAPPSAGQITAALTARMWQACREGADVAEIRAMVEAGASVDPQSPPDAPPSNSLLREVLKGRRDNSDLVAYLLDLGLSPEGGIQAPPLLLASRGPVPKPESAVILAKAGADPLVLRYDRYGREFAEQLDLLDQYDAPLLHVSAPHPSIAARRDYERRQVLVASVANPHDAVYSDSFYRLATPDDVRRAAQAAHSLGVRVFREREDYGQWGVLPPPPVSVFSGTRPMPRLEDRSHTPLAVAALNTGYPEVIDRLVEAGCDVNALDSRALEQALKNAHPGVLRVLLRHNPDTTVLDSGGWTAWALPAHVPLLAGAGLDILAKGPDGGFALEAVRRGNYPLARALADAGADLDREDAKGWRVLSYAILDGQYRFALDMIRAGASPRYRDKQGNNLLRLATDRPLDAPLPGVETDYLELLHVLREAYGSVW